MIITNICIKKEKNYFNIIILLNNQINAFVKWHLTEENIWLNKIFPCSNVELWEMKSSELFKN